jgi:hypothetical protein
MSFDNCGGCRIASSFSPHLRATSSNSMHGNRRETTSFLRNARGSGFIRFLFPLLSFFRARAAAPLSQSHAAGVGVKRMTLNKLWWSIEDKL